MRCQLEKLRHIVVRTHKVRLVAFLLHVANGAHELASLHGIRARKSNTVGTCRTFRTETAFNEVSPVRASRTPLRK